jgi:hypothetical protein
MTYSSQTGSFGIFTALRERKLSDFCRTNPIDLVIGGLAFLKGGGVFCAIFDTQKKICRTGSKEPVGDLQQQISLPFRHVDGFIRKLYTVQLHEHSKATSIVFESQVRKIVVELLSNDVLPRETYVPEGRALPENGRGGTKRWRRRLRIVLSIRRAQTME